MHSVCYTVTNDHFMKSKKKWRTYFTASFPKSHEYRVGDFNGTAVLLMVKPISSYRNSNACDAISRMDCSEFLPPRYTWIDDLYDYRLFAHFHWAQKCVRFICVFKQQLFIFIRKKSRNSLVHHAHHTKIIHIHSWYTIWLLWFNTFGRWFFFIDFYIRVWYSICCDQNKTEKNHIKSNRKKMWRMHINVNSVIQLTQIYAHTLLFSRRN